MQNTNESETYRNQALGGVKTKDKLNMSNRCLARRKKNEENKCISNLYFCRKTRNILLTNGYYL